MNSDFPDDTKHYKKKLETEADSLGRKKSQDAKCLKKKIKRAHVNI